MSVRKEINQGPKDPEQIYNLLFRLLQSNLIGIDVSFAYPFMVNQTQHNSYRVKWIAYEICCHALDQDSEFRILIVAQLLKDLEHSCLYNKIIAINAT